MAQDDLYTIAETLYSSMLTNVLDKLHAKHTEHDHIRDTCQLSEHMLNEYSIGINIMNNVAYVTENNANYYITPRNIAHRDFLYQFIKATAHLYFTIDELYNSSVCRINDNAEIDHLTEIFSNVNRSRDLLADTIIIMNYAQADI